MKNIEIMVEKHPEGYVVYPLGLRGVLVGEGNPHEEAHSDAKFAIKFQNEILDLCRVEMFLE